MNENTDKKVKHVNDVSKKGVGRRERIGRIVSDKMQKTAVVEVLRLTQHPMYKKIVKERIRYKAHNENDRGKMGDTVKIVETRPLSKDKCWRIVEIIKS